MTRVKVVGVTARRHQGALRQSSSEVLEGVRSAAASRPWQRAGGRQPAGSMNPAPTTAATSTSPCRLARWVTARASSSRISASARGNGVGLRSTYTSTPNTLAFQRAEGADDSFAILARGLVPAQDAAQLRARKETAREHLCMTVGKIDPSSSSTRTPQPTTNRPSSSTTPSLHNPLLDSGGDTGADAYGFMPARSSSTPTASTKGANGRCRWVRFPPTRGANFSGANRSSFIIGQAEINTRFNYLSGTWRLYAWSNNRAQNYDGLQRRNAGWGHPLTRRRSTT